MIWWRSMGDRSDHAPDVVEPRGVTIVDDDRAMRALMRGWLEAGGFHVSEHAGGRSAVLGMAELAPVVFLDLRLGDLEGIEVLRHVRSGRPDVRVIVVTNQRSVDTAVACMRAGAFEFIVKPAEGERVLHTARLAHEHAELARTIARLREDAQLGKLVAGRSSKMQALLREVARVSDVDVPVCVLGESGSGKELVARAIHDGGRRGRGPFVAVNCGAIAPSLQESELFGHDKGAFTGAHGIRHGRFEEAHGGTLFLDEVGEMSASLQAMLLRTLQERTIHRVGGAAEIPVDVRVVSATHRDLEALVRDGRFRQDLYFRLVVYPLHVPPLRDRMDDLPALVGHVLGRLRSELAIKVRTISPDALEALSRHDWPGNVRELGNVIQRAVLACDGDEIDLGHLPYAIRAHMLAGLPDAAPDPEPTSHAPSDDSTDLLPLRELERRAIIRTLEATEHHMVRAAKILGIGRTTLYRRIVELGIPSRRAVER
jgi:DNA-binding NtrC family response regulator